MKTGILIINYNNHQDLRNCVESCFLLEEQDFRIVIVENGSEKEKIAQNIEWLSGLGLKKTENPGEYRSDQITYQLSEKNLGFGKGNNLGFELLLSDRNPPEYIWLLNNDAVVDPVALTELVQAMDKQPNLGFAGSLIFDFENRERIQAAGGQVLPWLGITRHFLKGRQLNSETHFPEKADYQNGASLLVRSEMIRKAGGFLPEYFLYFEETDWQLRMQKLGWENRLVPGSRVYHKEAQSTRSSPLSFFHFYFQSAALFLKLNFSGIRQVCGTTALFLILVLRSRFSPSRIREGLKGIRTAWNTPKPQ